VWVQQADGYKFGKNIRDNLLSFSFITFLPKTQMENK